MNLERQRLIASIVEASSIGEASFLFKINEDLLEDYIFYISSDESSAILPSHAVDKDFKNTGAIRGLYKYKNVYILSSGTINNLLLKKESLIEIDYSISLDTQTVSYFRRFFIEPENKGLPRDFKDFFNFIIQPEINADPMPHIIENIYNLKNGGNRDEIFAVKCAYEKFRNLDYNYYIKENQFRFLIDNVEIEKVAKEQMLKEIQRLSNYRFVEEYERLFNIQYIIVLIVAIIRWKYPKKAINTKIYKYFEMCQEYIGLLSVRDANLAYAVFSGKSNFYSKIEKNSDDFIRKLKAMAWDIFHFRYLEKLTTLKLHDNTDYFFPAICSFDNSFVQLVDFFKLKGLVYRKGSSEIYPFYAFGMEDMSELTEKGRKKIEEDFFNDEAIMNRHRNYKDKMNKLEKTIMNLENEFFELKDI
ncbi:hypothetical protein [Acinetobacter sp.]|uniref:hypothetical protein n=1 Tax=Acinetobacter sp. TaxID=472 RepID=UPI0031E17E87